MKTRVIDDPNGESVLWLLKAAPIFADFSVSQAISLSHSLSLILSVCLSLTHTHTHAHMQYWELERKE